MGNIDFLAAQPYFILAFFAGFTLLRSASSDTGGRLFFNIAACLLAWLSMLPQLGRSQLAFHGLLNIDAFSVVFSGIILFGAMMTFLLNFKQMERQRVYVGSDIDALLLFSVCGALVMISAANLIVFFLGFELLSICVYTLSAIARKERASAEGALKYFILGAFSSAFLLYGIVLVFGATGTMEMQKIAQVVSADNLLLLVGLGLIIFGFAFKISAVPFHFWAPDVYQGAPVSVAAFMAVVVKAAAFGSFLRVMYVAFGSLSSVWSGLIWLLCVLTMSVGNVLALRQRSVKRMLAYSSVAHAGYALMGFLVLGSSQGAEATVFYLLVYSLMTVAAFGVVLVATSGSNAQYDEDQLDSLSGLGWTHPFLGFVMLIAILSLAGMPPLGGFIGKLYLFTAAIKGGYVGLAIIAAINSVISLYYYLSVIVVMYFSGERKLDWAPSNQIPFGSVVALSLSTLGTIYLGLFSENCLQYIRLAVRTIGV